MQLPPVSVEDKAQQPYKPEQPASPKYTTPLLDVPQTVTIIPAQVMKDQNLLTLRDILSTVPGITFGARYEASSAIVGDGTAPPPDEANQYIATACPGGRAPHAWLADGKSLYDRFGFDFTLLCLREPGETAQAFERAARANAIPLTTLAPGLDGLRDAYEADYALIRPDQVVAWRGNEGFANADAALAAACGHPSRPLH
jgi:hypothetical protein